MKSIFFSVSFLLASGTSFAQAKVKTVETVKIEPIITDADEPAQYPGGREAMNLFLRQNMQFPQTALDSAWKGKCYLRFIIETDGSINTVSVKRKVPNCEECDAEAIRVVKMMPKWIPAKNEGKIVRSYFDLPITFTVN